MDHSHCFTCNGEINGTVASIDRIQEPLVYGLFDGFVPFMRRDQVQAAATRLGEFREETAANLVGQITAEWSVTAVGRRALVELITHRAHFVSRTIGGALAPRYWPEF